LLTFLGCKNTSKIRNPRGPTCQLLVAAFCFQHYRCCVLLLHTTSNLFLSPSVSPFAIEQRSAELRHDRQTLHLCHRVVVSSELPTPPLIPRVPHCPSSSTTSASIFIDVGRCSAAALTTLNLPGRAIAACAEPAITSSITEVAAGSRPPWACCPSSTRWPHCSPPWRYSLRLRRFWTEGVVLPSLFSKPNDLFTSMPADEHGYAPLLESNPSSPPHRADHPKLHATPCQPSPSASTARVAAPSSSSLFINAYYINSCCWERNYSRFYGSLSQTKRWALFLEQ
jgi:hypothetical protein